jgi:AraC family transcriptional regulator
MTITAESPRHHIDVVVFDSPLMQIGRWRCPADHPHFADSGPASDALFVFPRKSVWIQHEGGRPFVADPNTVTYYNKGQRYRRLPLSAAGDHGEWFAVAPAAIAGTLAAHDPGVSDRPDVPFRFTHGPSDPGSYLRQRLVFEHVSREPAPDRLFVEESVLSVLGQVAELAYLQDGPRTGPPRRRPGDVDVVEAARDVIARRYRENLSLSQVAGEVGASVFHLSRVFHTRTGFSLHAYRNQLRLRTALERLAERDADLTSIALDLGFSSHSHFTETFRRIFGRPPSWVRRSL